MVLRVTKRVAQGTTEINEEPQRKTKEKLLKLKLEFQYFEGCPNHIKMQNNISEAIKGLEDKIEIIDVLVEDEETAKKVSFRGSPTLLINGEDIDGVPAPAEPSLSCRFYVNGIPSSDEIRKIIIQKINME